MQNLEDYINQTYDYSDMDYYSDYSENADIDYRPYLETLSYDAKLQYFEKVMDGSITFAYNNFN